MIAFQRDAIVSSASSQDIRWNCADPFGPIRFSGYSTRLSL